MHAAPRIPALNAAKIAAAAVFAGIVLPKDNSNTVKYVQKSWNTTAVSVCCGETEEAFLQIDHINNDGAAHRRQLKEASIYKWLRKHKYPIGFQLLCANCNFAKGKNGRCPHETRR